MRVNSPWRGIAFGIAGLGVSWACGGSEFGKAGSGARDGGVEDGGEPSTGDGGAATGSGGRPPTGGSRTGGRSTGSGGSAAGAVGSGGSATGGTGSGGSAAGATGSGGAMGAGGAPGSGGVVGAGGTPGSGGRAGAGGAVSGTQCGGFLGVQCEGNEWCDYEDASSDCGAGDVPGVCKPRPDACDSSLEPVCACDGKYYPNPCTANAEGFDVSSDTSCFPGGPGSHCNADSECQPGLKCCYPCGIPGCQNQCMVVTGPLCPLFP